MQEAYQRAAEQPTSSSNFYFHATIFDITQQLRAFPNEDLKKLLKDVKEKYVSLRYRKGQPVAAHRLSNHDGGVLQRPER